MATDRPPSESTFSPCTGFSVGGGEHKRMHKRGRGGSVTFCQTQIITLNMPVHCWAEVQKTEELADIDYHLQGGWGGTNNLT